jgi:glycerol-3-phosphate dehydrogenase
MLSSRRMLKRDLGSLASREHDLLVIGGGIYGAAAAWDAAQRGLSVALVEASDFGSGTSWNSVKTIHGGLRELQRAALGAVRESILERRAFLRIAPDLVRPLPFVVPTSGHGPFGPEAFALALRLYDLVGADRNQGLPEAQAIPRARVLSRDELLAIFPGLRDQPANGGALWTDAQATSTERLLLAMLEAASARGAALANYAEATALVRADRIKGASVHDRESGDTLEVRARMVLNAAGAAMGRVAALAGIEQTPVPQLRAFNLVLDRPVVTTHALGARSEGRFLYMVPWRGRTILGTGYAPPDSPADREEAAFLADARRAFPWAELSERDVALVHRGFVPGDARGLRRRPVFIDHERAHGLPGLVSIQGVKYTGARRLAEQAIDLVERRLGRARSRCRTATTPLPAPPPPTPLEEAARRCATDEMALHLADVVLRRLDLGTAGRPSDDELDRVEAALAGTLGWDAARRRSERAELLAAFPRAAPDPASPEPA